MGVGTCPLGYADPDVDAAVRRRIARGSMCTLNCPEEVELAELLCKLHPWAEMVRFARCGGEALAVAVRIARAHTGREIVAFCGYHGWHDWYLSANLADDKALDGHLLPGLEPAGVPRGLKDTALPFKFNDAEALEKILDTHRGEVAAIMMEPTRSIPPAPGFLERVRRLANQHGAALIFDEVTMGFRLTVGGAHMVYGVKPDIAVFAKAISNGYPMAAILGREKIIQAAQRSFISSTYWTEGIGPTAALATIRKLQRKNAPAYLKKIGTRLQSELAECARRHGLKLTITGHPPEPILSFDYGDQSQAVYTLYVQEMLARGFLASKVIYLTLAHKDKHIDAFLHAADEVFPILVRAVEYSEVEKLLQGPVAHTGFRRLT
jgi:glutamate-1-semialdehyde aminotransferase